MTPAGQNFNTRFFNGFSSKLPSNYSLKNPQKSELGKSNKLITGVQNENDIAGIFKDKYSALLCIAAYPQIPTKLLMRNQQLMRLFLLMIGRVFILMLTLVSRAAKRLNAEKSDGESDFNSCHLVYASRFQKCVRKKKCVYIAWNKLAT